MNECISWCISERISRMREAKTQQHSHFLIKISHTAIERATLFSQIKRDVMQNERNRAIATNEKIKLRRSPRSPRSSTGRRPISHTVLSTHALPGRPRLRSAKRATILKDRETLNPAQSFLRNPIWRDCFVAKIHNCFVDLDHYVKTPTFFIS